MPTAKPDDRYPCKVGGGSCRLGAGSRMRLSPSFNQWARRRKRRSKVSEVHVRSSEYEVEGVRGRRDRVEVEVLLQLLFGAWSTAAARFRTLYPPNPESRTGAALVHANPYFVRYLPKVPCLALPGDVRQGALQYESTRTKYAERINQRHIGLAA